MEGAVNHCARDAGIDPVELHTCATGLLGAQLEREAAAKTAALRPPHTCERRRERSEEHWKWGRATVAAWVWTVPLPAHPAAPGSPVARPTSPQLLLSPLPAVPPAPLPAPAAATCPGCLSTGCRCSSTTPSSSATCAPPFPGASPAPAGSPTMRRAPPLLWVTPWRPAAARTERAAECQVVGDGACDRREARGTAPGAAEWVTFFFLTALS